MQSRVRVMVLLLYNYLFLLDHIDNNTIFLSSIVNIYIVIVVYKLILKLNDLDLLCFHRAG